MDELKNIELKLVRVENDVKHTINSVDGLSNKIEKLIDALAQYNKESAAINVQIRTLQQSQEETKKELKDVKTRMWWISLVIAAGASIGTVGLENAIGLIK